MKNTNAFLLSLVLLFALMTNLAIELPAQSSELTADGSTYWIYTDDIDNTNEGEVQDYTIPSDLEYNAMSFTLRGADGGHAEATDYCKSEGGDGAITAVAFIIGTGENELEPGGTIRFIVGKPGADEHVSAFDMAMGGGGGGTAVLYRAPDLSGDDDWVILAVAGGGGGAFQSNGAGICTFSQKGQGGRSTEEGGDGAGKKSGDGGSNGNGGGGASDIYGGSGGGGAYSDGDGNIDSKGGGQGYPDGGEGYNGDFVTGRKGGWGFGGGGSGWSSGSGGGGGGGYSGGGGGSNQDNGGGGGSYVNSSYAYDSNITAGGNDSGTDDGYVRYSLYCDDIITSCKDMSITIDDGGALSFSPEDFDNGSSFGCGYDIDLSLTFDDGSTTKTFTCEDNGTIAVPIIFTSSIGTTASCYSLVTITDQCAPLVTCIGSISVESAEPLAVESLIDTNDDPDDLIFTFGDGTTSKTYTCDNIGESITETVIATDDAGNTTTCEVEVTVTGSSSTTATWEGSVDTDWDNACNWDTGTVPGSSTDVTIPDVTNDPVIASDVTIQSLEIEADASLTIEHSYTLEIDGAASIGVSVYGTLTNNGALKINNTGSHGLFGSGSDAEIKLYGDTYIGLSGDIGNINGRGVMLADEAKLIINNAADDNKPYLIIDKTASSGIEVNNSIFLAYLTDGTKVQVVVRVGSNSIGGDGIELADGAKYYNYGAELEVGNATRGVDIDASSTFENTEEGKVTVGDLGPLSSNGIYAGGTFYNTATVLIKNASSSELLGGENWNNDNTGTLMVDGETYGITYVDGVLVPGSSVGTMTTDGSLELAGTLDIEVESTTAGTGYDVLEVSGDLTLTSATLSPTISYTASQDDRIVFLTYSGSLSGTFTTTDALPDNWEVDYSVAGEIALVYSETEN